MASQFSFGLTFQSVLNNGMKTAITADGYINRVRDRIVSIPYNLFVWETINLGRVDIRGLDLTLALSAPLTSRHKLYLAGSYTLQDVADHSIKGSLSYGKQIAYTPRHTASGSITWENPWVNAVVHTTYASERYATIEHLPQTRLAAYNEWGFSLYRALTVNRHQLRLNVDLLNVFNRRYEIIRRYPMPGRAYQLKVSWNF